MKNILFLIIFFPLFLHCQIQKHEGLYVIKERALLFNRINANSILYLRSDSVYFENISMPVGWYSSGTYLVKDDSIFLNSYFDKSGNTKWDIIKQYDNNPNYMVMINLDYSLSQNQNYRIFLYYDTNMVDLIIKNDTMLYLPERPDSIRMRKCYRCTSPYPENEFSNRICVLQSYHVSSESGIEIKIHNSISDNYQVYENTSICISGKSSYCLKKISERKLIRILRKREEAGTINAISTWKTL